MSNTVEVVSTGQVLVSEITEQAIEVQVPGSLLVEVATAGPQGAAVGGLPTGGDPGNVLLKASNANYDAEWAATVDGGTFN
jgi:hypothetical protein